MKRFIRILLVLFLATNPVFAQLNVSGGSSGSNPPTLAQASAANAKTDIVCGNGTEGSWTQLVATSSGTSKYLELMLYQDSTGQQWFDIGTGAALSETAVISDILMRTNTDANGLMTISYIFPFQIASGTRISIRCWSTGQANTVSGNLIILY